MVVRAWSRFPGEQVQARLEAAAAAVEQLDSALAGVERQDADVFPLAAALREARLARGWSLEALAARCGASAAHLSRPERGQCAPSVAMVRRLLEAMGSRVELRVVDATPHAVMPVSEGRVDPTVVIEWLELDPVPLTWALDEAGVPYRLVGGLAATLQGLTCPVAGIELQLPRERLDEIAAAWHGWLRLRFDPRWGSFEPLVAMSPAEPGADRWVSDGGEVWVHWVPSAADLADGVTVVVEHDAAFPARLVARQPVPRPGPHDLVVATLPALARLDPAVARRLAEAGRGPAGTPAA